MIGKLLRGSGFGGVVDYVNDYRKGANLVAASEGINLTNNQSIIDSFIMHARLSQRVKSPVAHIILSFSPNDSFCLDDAKIGKIVRNYLKRMGYDDNQFVAFRHHDKAHPHVHIIVNRVNNQGRCTSDSHEKDRNVKVCRDITQEYGLYMARGKEAVKERRLHTMDAIRYQMMHAVRESLEVADNWRNFQEDLAKVGIRCQFRFNFKTSAIEGISFTIAKDKVKGKRGGFNTKMRHDVSFSGKQLDESLTLANLCVKLGNPIAIAHEQAKAMYDDCREDWYDSHTLRECERIDDFFPDFDSLFPSQAKAKMYEAPDITGTGEPIASEAFAKILKEANDIAEVVNDCVYVGIHALLELAFEPYQPTVSMGGGGGGNSQSKGWSDDDKYKRRHTVYRSKRKSGGLRM